MAPLGPKISLQALAAQAQALVEAAYQVQDQAQRQAAYDYACGREPAT